MNNTLEIATLYSNLSCDLQMKHTTTLCNTHSYFKLTHLVSFSIMLATKTCT